MTAIPYSHATLYDFIAARMLELDEPSRSIEQLFEDAEQIGFFDAWDIDRRGLSNAMKARGFVVSGGMIKFPEDSDGQAFSPIATDYETFIGKARQVLQEVGKPLSALELHERCDLVSAAMPGGRLKSIMLKNGFYYIRGAGYWTAPQFTMPNGLMLSNRIKSRRVGAIIEAFHSHGWPICGAEIADITKQLVTSSYLVKYALRPGSRVIGIGSGLYVPADLADEKPFAMSPNIVAAIIAVQPGDLIDDKDNTKLFRIGLLMERKGMATATISRSIRGGVRVQTMRIKLLPKGERILSHKIKNPIDAF